MSGCACRCALCGEVKCPSCHPEIVPVAPDQPTERDRIIVGITRSRPEAIARARRLESPNQPDATPVAERWNGTSDHGYGPVSP